LRLNPLAVTTDVSLSAEELPLEDRHGGNDQTLFTVRLRTRATTWRNATALSWSSAGQAPKTIAARTEGDRWQFVVGDRTLTLDWSAGKAAAE